jgi:hypothetical protein
MAEILGLLDARVRWEVLAEILEVPGGHQPVGAPPDEENGHGKARELLRREAVLRAHGARETDNDLTAEVMDDVSGDERREPGRPVIEAGQERGRRPANAS